jgi:cell shape-determining protein MreC
MSEVKKYKYKKKNKYLFRTCSLISLYSFKFSQFIEKKISLYCANKAEQKEVIEEALEKEETIKTYQFGEKVKEHKEEIIETYKNLYSSLDDCENENEILATSITELYISFQKKDYSTMENIFEKLNMKKVLEIHSKN